MGGCELFTEVKSHSCIFTVQTSKQTAHRVWEHVSAWVSCPAKLETGGVCGIIIVAAMMKKWSENQRMHLHTKRTYCTRIFHAEPNINI